MERAARLLSREVNPLPAHVVARRVGYSRDSGLRQAFLRFYGYNPSSIQPPKPEYLMDIDYYIDRIEHAYNNRPELESIREDLSRDTSIAEDDRRMADERIGTYLADLDRQAAATGHRPGQ